MVTSFSWSKGESLLRQFAPRSFLPPLQNYLWKIETGVVRSLTWLEDGTPITLGLWGAGEITGGQILRTPHQIECLTSVEATILSKQSWEQVELVLLSHICQLEELTLIRSYKKVDLMLLKLLPWLSKRFGCEDQQGRLITLRLTHQDIADLLGVTRVTVTRLLNQLEEQGRIQRLPLHRILLKEQELWHYEI